MCRREQSGAAEVQKEPVFVFGGKAEERGKGGRRHAEGKAWKRSRILEPRDNMPKWSMSRMSVGACARETG